MSDASANEGNGDDAGETANDVGAVVHAENDGASALDAGSDAATPMVEKRAASDAVITLSRTACYGYCPIYTLRIFGDGLVTYEGERFVRERGARSKRIAPALVRKLLGEAKRTVFFRGKPCLPEPVDLPSYALTIRAAPRAAPFVAVREHAPCTTEGAERFADEVDARVGSQSWTECLESQPEPCRLRE